MSSYRGLRHGLLVTSGLIGTAAAATAQTSDIALGNEPRAKPVEQIEVTGRRYGVDRLSSPKLGLPLLDTPRSVTVVDDALLMEQGRRSLRDALRNVTGVTLDAGEGNPPGGTDAVTIRGFSARDDIFVDGMRDVGLFFRDPFDVEAIEIIKGPGSAIAGRGSVGGSINLVSRFAESGDKMLAEASVGSDDFYRATIDINKLLSEEHGVALRLNALVHDAGTPGRDVVKNERFAFAPSLALGLGSDTEFKVSWYHMEQDDLPDAGIPNARNRSLAGSGFEGRPAPVPRDSFFGHSTDFRDVTVDRITFRLDHEFSEAVSLRTQLRYGRTHVDQIISSPRFVAPVTTIDETTQAVGNQKPRKQREQIFIGQTDLMVDFETGPFAHAAVFGVEASTEETRNRRRLDANGPVTNLFNPAIRAAEPLLFNGTSVETGTDVIAIYAFDNIYLRDDLILSGGIRYDHVETDVESFDETGQLPNFLVDFDRNDDEISGNIGLTWKPVENASLYAAWGTSFETNARAEIVQIAGGNNNPPVSEASFNVDPERTRSVEVGAKWDALDGRLSLTAAAFRINKVDARTPGSDPNDPPIVLDGEQRIRGFELSAVGALAENWNIFAGYTYLDGDVTKSNNPFEVGQQLPLTPEHSFTLWTSYRVIDSLTLGGGVQHVGSRTSNIASNNTGNIVIEVEDYSLLDLFAEYTCNENWSFRVNLDNITDSFYFVAVSSGQSIPGPGRALRLSAIAKF